MKRRDRPILPADPHPSSLLRLPLLKRALSDPTIRYVRRGVDARWNYQEQVSVSLAGFNPGSGCVFYRAHSYVDHWLADPGADAREFNFEDRLLPEATFLAHDYLHILAYQWITGLAPELGFGVAPITPENYEDFVFCHLLSEAVATVGLDYWFLARLDLNDALDIGTGFDGLTVSYRRNHEREYARFNPGFTVQRPEFFMELVTFYCTGEFEGFDTEDLRRSPLLLSWLRQELRYGENQREYTRMWLAFLADGPLPKPKAGLGAPVRARQRWQKRLMRQVGERLWAVSHKDEDPADRQPLDPRKVWKSPTRKPFDFRFINWNRICDEKRWARGQFKTDDDETFRHWYRQFLSRYPLDKVPAELLELRDDLLAKRQVDLCTHFFRELEPLPISRHEPRDLFMLA
ncbi:MAG: hypothetical protein ACI9WU_000915 [Myxococcota bacterium]|jgi:hypothetical protein